MKAKNLIAAMILGGVMVNFSSCENEEMKSQIEKMLENDSISKANLATLQKLLEKTQSELQNAKAENAISGNDFEKFQSMLNELENSLENSNASKSDLEKLKSEISEMQTEIFEVYKLIATNGHDYVDLGLPSGNLWATCNIGATLPDESGDKFAWGEIETKTEYNEDNYNLADKHIEDGELELSDDVAHVKWGGNWRTPSAEDWTELFDNTYTSLTINKTNFLIESKTNGKSIVLWRNSDNYVTTFNTRSISENGIPLFIGIVHSDGKPDKPIEAHAYFARVVRPVCVLK